MFTTLHRTKGGAPQLGARHPGELGPYGRWTDDDGGGLDDEELGDGQAEEGES